MENKLTDSELLQVLHSKVQSERDLTAEVIKILMEVDYRKLYLSMGYGSLIEFCIKELKYSESAAYRRVGAMRLSCDVPAINESIKSGALSLCVVAKAQSFVRREEKFTGQRLDARSKIELVAELENKSSRTVEKILFEKSPEQPRPEKLRTINEDKSEIRLTLSQVTLNKLDKLKSLISHKNPNATYADLIELMADLAIDKLDPQNKELRRKAAPTSQKNKRYIPSYLRKEVWKRANGLCSYLDKTHNRRCSSNFQLQIDHIKPLAKGGLTESSNLQLLCRVHNQFKGFQ